MPIERIAPAIVSLQVRKVQATGKLDTDDPVVIEEPLEIRVIHGKSPDRTEESISVTMRTPGHDGELASGFLFTEGIIPSARAITGVEQDSATGPNTIRISLDDNVEFNPGKLKRHFYTSSSCGVCGKTSIDAIRSAFPRSLTKRPSWQIAASLLYGLPGSLRRSQDIFDSTGGLHASGLFDLQGNLLLLMEDIGRHNALDKLIGSALQKDLLPLDAHILVLSGRACFELIQKAAMAGIRAVAAVGPPSSLAVSLAAEYEMTLVGFLQAKRFNIYTGAGRINSPDQ